MVALFVAMPLAHLACASPTAPPAAPGGGTTLALSFEDFEANVQPILVRHGCDAGGDCHGGGIRGSYELSPAGAKNPQFDFQQTSLQTSVSDPNHSPILMKPLAQAAGGTPHSFEPFADTNDPDFQTILGWIMAGTTR